MVTEVYFDCYASTSGIGIVELCTQNVCRLCATLKDYVHILKKKYG